MQKVIIDTNVIVSALIQKNYPFFIIDELLITNQIQLCISKKLLQEYFDVLSRPKFNQFLEFRAKAESLLSKIGLMATIYYPRIKLDIISDKDDNMILELADESNADFIITGNSRDFTMSKYKNTKIVTPKHYLANHQPIK